MNDRFLFIGGDKRMLYAKKTISERYECDALGLGVSPLPIGKYGRIVLPLPATRDGITINAPLSEKPLPLSCIIEYADEGAVVLSGGSCPALEKLCEENGLSLEIYADEPLTLKNAALTAEAAAAILSESTESAIFGSKAVLTGYGRCSRLSARLLKAFGAEVTVVARSADQRALAEVDGVTALPLSGISEALPAADFIVNTVPARLFSEAQLSLMQSGAVYMELATLPPEPLKSLCEAVGVKYIHAAGLPGRCSPKTAGELIAKTIQSHL